MDPIETRQSTQPQSDIQESSDEELDRQVSSRFNVNSAALDSSTPSAPRGNAVDAIHPVSPPDTVSTDTRGAADTGEDTPTPTSPSADVSSWQAFMRLMRLGRGYVPAYVGLCLLALISSASGAAMAQMLRMILNAAVSKNAQILASLTVAGVVLVLLIVISNFLASYLTGALQNKSTRILQELVYTKVLRVPMRDLREYHTGDLFNRIHDSCTTAQTAVNQQAIQVFQNGAQVVIVLGYLTFVSPVLTAGSLVIALIVPTITVPLSKRMNPPYGLRQQAKADEQSIVQDSVQGIEIAKSLSVVPSLRRRYLNKANEWVKYHRGVLVWEAVTWRINYVVSIGGLLFALGYGGYLVMHHRLDIGAIGAFLLAFEQLMGPISQLSWMWPAFLDALSQSKRIFEVLDLPDEQPAPTATSQRGPATAISTHELNHQEISRSDIAFYNVSFSYQPETPVLRDFNLIIEAGKTTALVGPSGGGKSTVIQLLMRFYDPALGSVLIGPHDALSLAPSKWRKCVGYVAQDATLFSGSLRENILLGKPGAPDGEWKLAARLARVEDFAQNLPDGYDTLIGERGIFLSGGERQRVALARAILRDPPILVLDEPTSALDSENEQLLQEALDNATQGRTTLVVAHRLSTIYKAHRIAYVEAGRVKESGGHKELLDMRGYYYRLHQSSLLKDAMETEQAL